MISYKKETEKNELVARPADVEGAFCCCWRVCNVLSLLLKGPVMLSRIEEWLDDEDICCCLSDPVLPTGLLPSPELHPESTSGGAGVGAEELVLVPRWTQTSSGSSSAMRIISSRSGTTRLLLPSRSGH